jgi:hypothetical protein
MLAFNIYRIWKMPTVPLGSSPPPIFSVSGAGVATAGVVSTIDLAKLLASIKELIRIGALDPAIIGGLGLLGSPEGFPLPELEKPSVSQMASTKMYKTKPFTRGGVKFRLWGRGKDIQAFRSTEAGAQVYVIRDANGKVIYVGITERDSFTRLGEHLSKQPGEFLGKASRIEIRGAGLTEKQALALEQDLIQTHKPAFNKHLTPYSQKFQGTLPDPIDVKDANNIFISFEITFK